MSSYRNYATRDYTDLKQLLHDCAERFGEHALFLPSHAEDGAALSYRRFADDVDALGTALLARGWQGKRILLLGEGSPEWATAYLSLIAGVGVVIPIDVSLRTRRIERIVARTRAEAIVCPDSRAAELREDFPALDVLSLSALPEMIADGDRRIREGDRSYLDAEIDPDALATVVFTSGSTDRARAVMLSHRAVCFALSEMCRMVGLDESDVFLAVLPPHLVYQTVCGLLCPLYRGAAVAFSRGFAHLTEELGAVRPTVLLCLPLLTELLYRNLCTNVDRLGLASRVALHIKLTDAIPHREAQMRAKRRIFAPIHELFGGRLRLIVSGGDRVDPTCLRGFRALGFQALQGYGMTESASLLALNRDTYPNDRAAGMTTPRTLLDVCESEEGGIGEIRFKGDNLMLGYLDDPDLTARTIRGGWLYTGDLGTLDDEGFVYVMGRVENAIRVGKRRIFPEELEALLRQNKYIAEAVVIADPRRKKTTVPIAVIYPDPKRLDALLRRHGALARDVLDLELRRAIAQVNGCVAAYKRLGGYLLRSTPFDRNAAGKLIRSRAAREAARPSEKED